MLWLTLLIFGQFSTLSRSPYQSWAFCCSISSLLIACCSSTSVLASYRIVSGEWSEGIIKNESAFNWKLSAPRLMQFAGMHHQPKQSSSIITLIRIILIMRVDWAKNRSAFFLREAFLKAEEATANWKFPNAPFTTPSTALCSNFSAWRTSQSKLMIIMADKFSSPSLRPSFASPSNCITWSSPCDLVSPATKFWLSAVASWSLFTSWNLQWFWWPAIKSSKRFVQTFL